MLHTNLNFKIVQESTNITYNMIVLKTSTTFIYNENSPIKNSQKTVEIEFEYYHPYRAELMQNMPKIGFLTNHRTKAIWVFHSLFHHNLHSKIYLNLHFYYIRGVYSANSCQKNLFIFHFWLWMQIPILIYNANVILFFDAVSQLYVRLNVWPTPSTRNQTTR